MRKVVPDGIVVELVSQQLRELEKEGRDYIIEGYPRTREQALSLQRMGIVPDKFFILNVGEAAISSRVSANIASAGEGMSNDEANSIAQKAILEYTM